MAVQPVLIAGRWRSAHSSGVFQATNPATGELLPAQFPVSEWADCDAALTAAAEAFVELRELPGERFATFLEAFAERITARAEELVETANAETGLPKKPRLAEVELPRTTGQLRQAAAAAREGSWRMAVIDAKANIRSWYAPLGPVVVFGPNNFPFAFGSISGGDFAAAIAAGCPVIAKANSSHPATTQIFAEEARLAVQDCELPAGTVQLLYRTAHEDGERLVADPRLGATGYTGARGAGLKLKAAADAAGKPIYLELSSTNPVVILPGALKERLEKLVEEFATSCLMGTGQFCTNPGLILLLKGMESDTFLALARDRFEAAPAGVLLSAGVQKSLAESVKTLEAAGAEVLLGGRRAEGEGFRYANTLLQVSGDQFLANPEALQHEAFGNASLVVVADVVDQLVSILESLEGNLTGCIYSDTRGSDDELYRVVEPALRSRVGRLLNDRMPTGVAVSPAMNHGGPFPATGHPAFTAVGIPASILRFAALHCYDNVRQERLPEGLRDANPNGRMWRSIGGEWTREAVSRS